ncbi:MAG: triose-phosphate isomerase, partial [Candidatus Omnitrophica bacterium]|nr:triose-phosphate isomerase [Candidatus Omnitrophota bacterium]
MREKAVGRSRMRECMVLCGIIVFILAGFRSGVYAGGAGTDNLRPRDAAQSGRDTNIKDDVVEKMGDGGSAAVTGIAPILFTDNTATLPTGAHTGLRNIQAAASDDTDGELFNHSEKRGRLEEQIKDKLGNLAGQPGMSVEAVKKQWAKDLKNMGLREDEIKPTLQWLEDFLSSYSTLTSMYQSTRQDRTDELSALTKKMSAEKERMARRVVNKIINAELKRLIDFEKNGFIPVGDGKFTKYVSKQNVLCVGETIDQKNTGATQTVIREDLTEILDGITLEDILSIRMRTAYEPRWMIGLPKDQIPGIEVLKPMIESNHRFIKEIIRDLYGFEIAVDYGGSLNKDNVEILLLEPVNGGLIGGAGKTDTGISPVL